MSNQSFLYPSTLPPFLPPRPPPHITKQYVVGLEVAVYDPVLVQVGERTRGANGNIHTRGPVQRLPLIFWGRKREEGGREEEGERKRG